MRIREEGEGSSEAYEVRIGGTQRCFGQKLGEFKFDDMAMVLTGILDAFVKQRTSDETLAQCVARAGMDPFIREVFG
jgi:sulfite reductase beta subunit-like hemoprotein